MRGTLAQVLVFRKIFEGWAHAVPRAPFDTHNTQPAVRSKELGVFADRDRLLSL